MSAKTFTCTKLAALESLADSRGHWLVTTHQRDDEHRLSTLEAVTLGRVTGDMLELAWYYAQDTTEVFVGKVVPDLLLRRTRLWPLIFGSHRSHIAVMSNSAEVLLVA